MQTSKQEAQVREDLASLYRLVAHFRMTDLIDTHISARIPGTPDHFLINRYGALFDDMRPEDLVKVDAHGQAVDSTNAPTQRVNVAGFVIHSAVHMARHDLACVIHTHTADGMAVSCLEEGLLPITQHAMKFYGRLGYHAYEGIALDTEERERLVADLGTHNAMILRNHGLLAAGHTIPAAFQNILFLERACQAQVKALSGGRPLVIPPHEVCERAARQFDREEADEIRELAWQAALRLLH